LIDFLDIYVVNIRKQTNKQANKQISTMGSCLSLTQPIILPESTLPRKLTEQEEKEVEILMEKFADEILQKNLCNLNTI